VFDRGMVSDGNLNLLEQDRIKYISAMDRNQLKAITNIDYAGETSEEVVKAIMASEKFTKLSETTYYHEVKSGEGEKRRYILCFNPQLCEDQRNARRQAVSRFESSVRAINQELLEAKNSREEDCTLNKFKREMSIEQKGYLEVVLRQKNLKLEAENGETKTIRTYQGKVMIDEKKMINAGQLDGFWMIVTNHTERTEDNTFKMSAEEVIKPYKDKVIIESSFRDIKSFLEISPVHVWTIEHVKAHYTICVLAYLLDRTLSLRLHEKPGVCSKDVVAHPRLYEELSKCLLNRYKIKGTATETVGLTCPTDKQKELLERIGLTHMLQEDIAKKYFAEFASYV
jgi:transposase